LKFWIKFFIQLVGRYGLVLIGSTIAGVIIFWGIHKSVLLISALVPKTKIIGIAGKYNISTLPPKISHLISYGLTDILPNGKATSSPIISHWTIKDEGHQYLFFLKPNVPWQDGKPLTPDQINYQIEGAKFSPSENTVTVSLDLIFSPLPTFLNKPIFKKNNIGLGPYRIEKARVSGGNFLSLSLVSMTNRKEKILFKFYPNEKALKTAFKLNEVDEIWEISDITDFSSWKNLTIKSESAMNKKYVAIFFNTRKNPFSSKRIRQALAYSIKKPAKKDRALGPISPASWAYNGRVKNYNFNPQHAKKLLEKEELQWEENFVIKIYALPEFLGLAEKIKSDWQNYLGVKSEIHISSFVPGVEEFDVFVGYGVTPADPDQYFFWHSTQQGNITGINSPKIDQLLEKGRKTIDFEERKRIYFDFQRALSEEVPAVFLLYPPSYRVSRQQ